MYFLRKSENVKNR